jgi:hypothetical protein
MIPFMSSERQEPKEHLSLAKKYKPSLTCSDMRGQPIGKHWMSGKITPPTRHASLEVFTSDGFDTVIRSPPRPQSTLFPLPHDHPPCHPSLPAARLTTPTSPPPTRPTRTAFPQPSPTLADSPLRSFYLLPSLPSLSIPSHPPTTHRFAQVTEKYVFFFGYEGEQPEVCFQQWFPCPMVDTEGRDFPTTEHYMMWRKAVLMGDKEIADKIMGESHPSAAK